MILKNCYIYDERTGQEKLVDFLVSERIIAVKEKLSKTISIENKTEIKLSGLDAAKIVRINEHSEKYILDCEGLITIPGGVDPHVHFDTPGFTHREDFFHGSMSAAAGGITTVIDMPCTSLPPVTNGKNFDEKFAAIKNESVIDFGLYGGVCANNFEQFARSMEELAGKKVKGFKTYFVSGMKTFPQVSLVQFELVIKKAKELNLPVLLHAEDNDIVSAMTKNYENANDDYLRYCNSRPVQAEVAAVANAIEIAKRVNGNLHIVHVASSEAAKLVNQVRNEYNITYETCPHYLSFTQDDFKRKGSSLKTAPIVKSKKDQDELWKYLEEGDCSFVASDHAPAPLSEKQTGSFWKDYGGIPGVQTLIPVVFSKGYKKQKLSLKRFSEVVSTNATKRYNLYPQKGSLQVGSDADFAIINPNISWKFETGQLLSKGKTSPFDNEMFTGKVVLTILRGKIVYSDAAGITVPKGYGKYLD
ncbi:MAG: allantoinase AllB [Ignavibacteriaceae bacterium]|jgi:allantoinase|nr:allantoinase AllB [Ignavibacteriaceae bacterium]